MRLPRGARAAADRLLGVSAVRTARRVIQAYGDAGGGLLAGGLTYGAMFALLPSLLLLTGVLGFVVDDPHRRAAIVEGIGRAVPPLEGLVATSLDKITEGAAGAGTLGLIGLAWGASRFYGSLDDAFGRVFRDAPKRGIVARTVRGVLSVVLLVSAFLAALVLTGIASYLAEQTAGRFGDDKAFWQVASPALAAVVFVAATALIYRVVPGRRVPWSALRLPALVVGIALALLTQLFSLIAPRLIGVASVYGAFVAIFAAMVWLSTGFQILLLGAAWVADRANIAAPAGPRSNGPVVTR